MDLKGPQVSIWGKLEIWGVKRRHVGGFLQSVLSCTQGSTQLCDSCSGLSQSREDPLSESLTSIIKWSEWGVGGEQHHQCPRPIFGNGSVSMGQGSTLMRVPISRTHN